ncbi:MAG: FkbM family methyltransferase [Flavobacteriales bacterium]|nr:FkbM family methyltransferase [Flavobacteriales bacterium]
MFSKCDDGIVNLLYYGQDYVEKDDLNVFLSLVKNDFVVFDVGANTGLYSLAVKAKDPSATVYAFEPHPINLERLDRNVQLNDLKGISTVGMAVGALNKVINFTIPSNDQISDTSSAIDEFSKNSYRGEIKWKQIQVKQTTLDDFLIERSIDLVNLIKIDVEGYELSVFDGAKKTIESSKPFILVESFLDKEKRTYFSKFISDFDYEVFFIHNKGIVRGDISRSDFPGLNFLLVPKTGLSHFIPLADLEKIT